MLVYAASISPRLQYIIDFFGNELGKDAFTLTTDKHTFQSASGPRINYSYERMTTEELWIKPHALLFEKGIKPQHIDIFELNGLKVFFKTAGDIPFDIFAASFYLLSRYEEYLPHEKDIYGRYAHENSLAFKENFLDTPLVNTWLQEFKKVIHAKWPSFPFRHTSFRFLPTYDIDEAYSYKHKEWTRSAGASIKDLLKGRFAAFNLRRKVLNGYAEDPFDSYSWINDLHRPHKLSPRYFFLVAERTGKYDRNIIPKETALQTIIKQHAEKYAIGVHPSWQSGDDISLIKKEIQTIEHITQVKITASRQHYIRFTLPHTFRYLAEAGIKEDFSMGYGSINGFRASVASPFYWYDLEKDQTAPLLLYPFCYMEANSFYEQKISAAAAWDEMMHYYQEVKKVNGLLITIWHNTFLGTDEKFKGWREVYKRFVDAIHLTVSV